MDYAAGVGKRCGLKRELDSGEDTAGAGFLPGEIDAVDDGEGGNDGNDPEYGAHAIEDSADDEQNDALGALLEADFAQGDEGLGAGAGIADHDGAGGGAVLAAGHWPIQNVPEAGEENNERAGEKTANGEESSGAKIHDQAKKCEEVGIDSRGGDYADYLVEQPFAAVSNSPG